MLSPLRKGRFKRAAVERNMMLLNKGLWPETAEEGLVKRLMEQAKVAVEEADDGWETDIETDDDCGGRRLSVPHTLGMTSLSDPFISTPSRHT
jgi:hypothetical protein